MTTTTIPRPTRLPSDILREDGWCKGDFKSGAGYCLVGAFQEAVMGNPSAYLPTGVYNALEMAIGKTKAKTVMSWNDSRKSAEPVIAAAERAERALGWRP